MSTPNPADIVVVREGTRNNLTGDYVAGAERTLSSVVWAPSGGPQEQSARSQTGGQVVSRRDLYDDSGFEWKSTDRVRFPGETGAPWEVVGDAAQWAWPWGADTTDQVVQIEKTTG